MSGMESQNNNLLLDLLENNNVLDESIPLLTVNLYLTLLSLNNNNYKEDIELSIINTLDDYLRKVNNLKVKIQLKRKDKEINDLLNKIIEIYEENKYIIEKYNPTNINIIDILNSKDTSKLTNLIDTQTKEKMLRMHNKEYYDNLRNKIINNLPLTSYQIDNNTIIIDIPNETISISLSDFYKMFDYLLNIDSYNQPLITTKANRLHTILIANIIKSLITINNKEIDIDVIISLILNSLLSYNIDFYNDIDLHNFNIDNIKITDLYREADNKNISNPELSPSWRKVTISNEFMYHKIKNILEKGTYYFEDNKFILENIDNNTSDFKTSITKDNMKIFLKDNLNYLNKINTYTK